jgi:dihydrofolate reductase
MSRLTLIAAATQSSGIGLKSDLPWRLRKEMAYFTRVTSEAPEGSHNAVIMGRKSWECIPDKYRPLPHRANVVITHNKSYTMSVMHAVPLLAQT